MGNGMTINRDKHVPQVLKSKQKLASRDSENCIKLHDCEIPDGRLLLSKIAEAYNAVITSQATNNSQKLASPEIQNKNQSRPHAQSDEPLAVKSCKALSPTLMEDQPIKSCFINTSPEKREANVKKHVRFNCDAKTWDGPRPGHLLLERLALEFWWQETPAVTVLQELAVAGNKKMLTVLYDLMLAAMKNVDQNIDSRGAELVPGGGKYGIRLKACGLAKLMDGRRKNGIRLKPSIRVKANRWLAKIGDTHNMARLLLANHKGQPDHILIGLLL